MRAKALIVPRTADGSERWAGMIGFCFGLWGCSTPPEPVQQTTSSAVVADSGVAGVSEHSASGGALSPATMCGAVAQGEDLADHPEAVTSLGLTVMILEPLEMPAAYRIAFPALRAEAVGSRFRARVLAVADASGREPPASEIEIHQWDAVQYDRYRVEMDPADERPGHAFPRVGEHLLAVVTRDGLAGDGWSLGRAWHIRTDGTTQGAALGQRADLSAAQVMDAFQSVLRARSAAQFAGMGGGR